MEQREKLIELSKSGLSPKEIQEQLKDEYGKHAYSISAIYKWHSRTVTGHTDSKERDKPGKKPDEQLLVRIEQELEAEPFTLVRMISHKLGETPSIVWRYMTQELKLVFKTSRWVPHMLTNEQKKKKGWKNQKHFMTSFYKQNMKHLQIL